MHILNGVRTTENYGVHARGDLHHLRRYPHLVRRGERSPSAKLNETQVRTIIGRLAKGERQTDIAREYNVTNQLIWRIANNKCWKHIERSVKS